MQSYEKSSEPPRILSKNAPFCVKIVATPMKEAPPKAIREI